MSLGAEIEICCHTCLLQLQQLRVESILSISQRDLVDFSPLLKDCCILCERTVNINVTLRIV